jgi:hypothetical protein
MGEENSGKPILKGKNGEGEYFRQWVMQAVTSMASQLTTDNK